MGIFDKLLRAIGFEDENQEKIEVKNEDKTIDKKKDKNVKINSKFDLKNLEEETLPEEKEVETCEPATQSDVEEIANKLVSGFNVMANFIKFSDNDRMRALDFLSGVLFILKGEIEKIDKTTYLFKI